MAQMERVNWMPDNISKFIFSGLRIHLTLIPYNFFFCYKTWLNCNMMFLGHFLIQQSDLSVNQLSFFQNKCKLMLFQYVILNNVVNEVREENKTEVCSHL